MRVWGKAKVRPRQTTSVARAALEGLDHSALIREAALTILASEHTDRVGVWVEPPEGSAPNLGRSFEGIVADREQAATPAEWSRLSTEAHLPKDLFSGSRAVEQEFDTSQRKPLIGILTEMRRGLWVPIETRGRLRGVIFAGRRSKADPLPWALAESVAAELALALELQDQRRNNHIRSADNVAIRNALTALTERRPAAEILRGIVEESTRGSDGTGRGSAVFAVIGKVTDPRDEADRVGPNDPPPRVDFLWRSGDPVWTRMIEKESLRALWQSALESRRVIGREPNRGFPHDEPVRVVAFPLQAQKQTLGVLVAGIHHGSASLGAFELMELRAALAAQALYQDRMAEQNLTPQVREPPAPPPLLPNPSETQENESFEESATVELRNVIEWLDEGVVLFGVNHQIRAMNTRFAQIAGLTPEETAGVRDFPQLLGALAPRTADAESLTQQWLRLAHTREGATREEFQIERPVRRLLERSAHPVLASDGTLLGRVEVYRDLTAQHLFQSNLLHTQKLAGLGQLLSGVAHELSNPLTSILGYAQRLLREETLGQSREARQIFHEAERASAILGQLLLSARESRPERRRVALNQLVSRTVDLQSHSFAAEGIHVELELDPALPFVHGDAGQLQQVLTNLIGNAGQALAGQQRAKSIRVATRHMAENRVLLEVADTGPGIPDAVQARIFDPFFTTKPAGIGTGLGLSIVTTIVREHGGHVRVRSTLGEGSVFYVELPALSALEMPRRGDTARPEAATEYLPSQESSGMPPGEFSLAPWAGARVLILEDEPTVARLIADVLEDEGLLVEILLDSRKALSLTEQQSYALVICDMKMPELDGEEFYRTLLRRQSPLRRRFLFVTGDVLSARTRNFLEQNRLPHVAKPFRVEELTARIRAVLEANEPPGASGSPMERKKNAATK